MRMKLSKILWHANISAEYSHLDNPKFKKQLDETLERHIPFMIVFGEEEISRDVVKVKNMKTHEEVEVNMRDIVNYLITQGCKLVQSMGELSI
jgi:histidyl-tRNA synthetase